MSTLHGVRKMSLLRFSLPQPLGHSLNKTIDRKIQIPDVDAFSDDHQTNHVIALRSPVEICCNVAEWMDIKELT